MSENGWREQAASAGKNTAWWQASTTTDPTAAYLARALCRICPVRPQCASEALRYLDADPDGLYGCWAGVTVQSPSARTQLRHLAANGPQIL